MPEVEVSGGELLLNQGWAVPAGKGARKGGEVARYGGGGCGRHDGRDGRARNGGRDGDALSGGGGARHGGGGEGAWHDGVGVWHDGGGGGARDGGGDAWPGCGGAWVLSAPLVVGCPVICSRNVNVASIVPTEEPGDTKAELTRS